MNAKLPIIKKKKTKKEVYHDASQFIKSGLGKFEEIRKMVLGKKK